MGLEKLLGEHSLIMAEGSIAEQLRRFPDVSLHPTLFNTPLIYQSEEVRGRMTELYREYLEVASAAELPLLLTAPTWRLDARRVGQAGVPETINTDAVNYICNIRHSFQSSREVLVGGLIGPKEDCYRPELSPSAAESEMFHTPQMQELSEATTDFLLAQTIPSVEEALGIARVAEQLGKPYIISFCAGPDGSVLDGTRLDLAMDKLDEALQTPPVGYSVNCTHPSFFLQSYAPGSLVRLIGIQANGSSKDVTRLDGSDQTQADPIEGWARSMKELHQVHGVKILGGCCGTRAEHFRCLFGV